MRSLLVALDDTPAGDAAVKFALALSTKHGAALTGVNFVTTDYLPTLALVPVELNVAYFNLQADMDRLEQAHQRNERLRGGFLKRCTTQNVKGDILTLEGSPVAEVRGVSAVHDLIVIGRDSDFHGAPGGGLAKAVEKILKDSPRPLIITPEVVRDPSRIVIAYDGSIPAARTLQVFTLLGLASKSEVHVISIASEQDVADRCVRQARAYLGLYGITCTAHPIASASDPAEFVISGAKSLDADLLVMGAYGHRGWRETLLGSFSTRLLSECPTALFIHH